MSPGGQVWLNRETTPAIGEPAKGLKLEMAINEFESVSGWSLIRAGIEQVKGSSGTKTRGSHLLT